MPKFSVKKPFTVVVGVIMLFVLGIVSFTKMTTDLLPEMSLPYVVVVTTYPGASPERVESGVTRELESSLGTVNGVVNVTSTSSENFSIVVLEFEENTNMDSAMVKLSTAIDQLTLPDMAGTPILLEISPDMMATMMVSIDYEGMDIYELSQFVEEEITPYLERQNGVASVEESGLVEKSVEIRLDQEKIDVINEKLLNKVTESMDEAQEELNDARSEIEKAQEKLDSGKQELAAQQETTTNELAETSKLLDQAMATQSAYSAQVSGLEASKLALETEKKAYTDNKIVDSYNQINEAFLQLRDSMTKGSASYEETYNAIYGQVYAAACEKLYPSVLSATLKASLLIAAQECASTDPDLSAEYTEMAADISQENAETILDSLAGEPYSWGEEQLKSIRQTAQTGAETAATAMAKTATENQIETMKESLPSDVEDAIANPDKLEAVVTLMQQAGQGELASMLTVDSLTKLNDIVNTRIPQIDTELANLNIEIQTAKAVLEQVNKTVTEAIDNYEALESGKITAAASFGALNAQMNSGESALEDALAQIEEGEEALENARKTALENANLDSLLNMDVLSQLLYAQNFSMPAGYIYEGETQYLLKVGDEYSSLEELENTLLCNIDGIGDVRLCDVAYVTMIDNAGESYAKMNGNQAVLLSIYKSSTAGTSDVSRACNQAIEELEAKYEGLHITALIDQGDYIKLIVNEVLSNLVWGALLAILVLAIFLRDTKPTIVVAFSIPISVLFAVVLMYFSGVTLNIISLSGLALGVGMLVDNSIVVIENIYRLRSQGVPAARAAVMGANQVAGAIFASTLTTVCVFLPIVFTDGLTRQLFTDMALTIAYSLGASLIVALTVVPCMGATVLKNSKPKSHRLFDKILAVYEKTLRFCLKVKAVPLALSILLLVFSLWQVSRTGLILIPEMGGNQMSASVTAPEGLSDEESYALADRLMNSISSIHGVETVGAMSGGGMMSMMGGGSSSGAMSFTFYVLLDEEASQDNSSIVTQMEQIMEQEGCDGSVSKSNMDLSSLMASGLQIDIYGKKLDTLLSISEDMMELLDRVEGFTDISNGQEEGDTEIRIIVDKDKAMELGLTVAQVFSELSSRLTTEKTATTLVVGSQEYPVIIVDETDTVTLDSLMSEEFEVKKQNDAGEEETEIHILGEFAAQEEGKSMFSIRRDNQTRYISVSAVTEDGYNTTLLSREVEKLLKDYEVPDGYSVEIAGESTSVMDAMQDIILMIALAIVFIYLIMVAQFQSILSPFIVLFTIPLAFTGGFLAVLLSGEPLSMIAMMGFLVLAGVVVNNGIVFVDYVNQLRLEGMAKKDALIETGKTRMRPILMTALTTILAMCTMAFSKDAAASMAKGMAVVTIGGLSYATLMTLFIVPVLYDMFFRRQLKKVDLGEDSSDRMSDEIGQQVTSRN